MKHPLFLPPKTGRNQILQVASEVWRVFADFPWRVFQCFLKKHLKDCECYVQKLWYFGVMFLQTFAHGTKNAKPKFRQITLLSEWVLRKCVWCFPSNCSEPLSTFRSFANAPQTQKICCHDPWCLLPHCFAWIFLGGRGFLGETCHFWLEHDRALESNDLLRMVASDFRFVRLL